MNLIYQIQNVKNGKLYVGSTCNLSARKSQHLSSLRLNKHHSLYLQRSYNKYGSENFIFSVLEDDISNEQLLDREQYYIDLLKPIYNSCPVAGTRKGAKHTLDSIKKMKISKKGRKVSEEYKKVLSDTMEGNKFATGNTNRRKVTLEIVQEVLKLREKGLGCRKIAKLLNLNKTTILNIFNKKFNYG